MSIKRIYPNSIEVINASSGDVLLYNAANGAVEFGTLETSADNNVWVNANDYATYTSVSSLIDTVQANVSSLPDSAANDYNTYSTVTGLIDSVQSNLTSIIASAPSTLDTLAEIAAALENDANLAVTLSTQIGSIAANVAALPIANLYSVSQDILPATDNTHSLGSPAKMWKDIYVGPGSLYVNGQKVLEDNSGTITFTADDDQSLRVKTGGTGVLTLQSNTTINIAGTLQIAAGKTITSSDGIAIVLGDKLDANNNQIINVGSPTADSHVATKAYVDDAVIGATDSAANDYTTYTTLTSNTYNTYTTLSGLIDTVQSNVSSSPSGGSSSALLANAISDRFTVSSSNTFTLSQSVADANNIIVSYDGIIQSPNDDYVVSGNTLSLSNTVPLFTGLGVEVRHLTISTPTIGTVVYETIDDLPSSGTIGAQAYVTSTARLYLWAGAGWYNIALINQTPAIQSILDGNGESSPFVLSNEGVATTITMIAADPEGFPVTYSAVPDSAFNAMATLSQVSNVFTITPTAIEGDNTGTITFKASDGINLASEISTFTLTFITTIENSRYTTLLVQSVGANNGVNSTFTDASANNLTLTAAGDAVATTFSPYRAGGYSVSILNGDTDILTIANDSSLNIYDGDFTVEAWLYPTAFNANQNHWVSKGGSVTREWSFNITSTQIIVYWSTDGGAGGDSTVAISTTNALNEWAHIAVTKSGNTITIYKNGVALGVGNFTSIYAGTGTVQVGRLMNFTGIGHSYRGYISDLRIVKGAAIVPPIGGPAERLLVVGNTSLLIGHISYFADGSTNSHLITPSGNIYVKPFGPYDHEPYDPAVNVGSVYFDGVVDQIATTTAVPAISGDFTVECWIYPTTTTGVPGAVFEIGTYSTGIMFAAYLSSDTVYVQGTNMGDIKPHLKEHIWQHVAISRVGDIVTCYINGVAKLTANKPGTVSMGVARIGALNHTSGSRYQGYISNFRLINGTAVYTSAFTPPTEPVTAISGTSLLINGTDGSIIDASQTSALTLAGNTKSSTTQIKYGNSSMYFDGTGRLDLITPVPSFGTGDFTVEAWVYQITENTYSSLCEIGNHLTVNGIIFITTSTGNARIYSGAFYGSRPFPLGQWNHIAFVRSSGNLLIFVNGSAGSPVTFTNNLTDNSVVNVGGRSAEPSSGYLLNGYVQDFRVTKGLARYTTTFTPPAALLEG